MSHIGNLQCIVHPPLLPQCWQMDEFAYIILIPDFPSIAFYD